MTRDVADVRIEGIAAGGDGVARTEGMVVFVPRAAPGDLARVELARSKRFARGRLLEVLDASPDRVDPPCPHYTVDRCGGCQVQHLAYEAQLRAKGLIVRDALGRIGKRDVAAPEVRASDRPWRYRRKLTLALRRRRVGDAWVAGLHPFDDPVGVFALADCPITEEAVLAGWRDVLPAAHLLPPVTALRASVRLLDAGYAVVVEGGAGWGAARQFFDAVPSIAALWWKPENGWRRLIADRAVAAAGGSFAQVNRAVADALRRHVVERARAHSPATVVDAYAGTGDTAVALATAGVRVTAIELDREAAAVCASRLPAGSTAVAGRVEDRLPGALPADVVIVNPPRGGMHAAVPASLDAAAASTRAVVYVSCDPATLARDLALMPRWRIASLLCFDMFPQTAHVETVCELVPEAA